MGEVQRLRSEHAALMKKLHAKEAAEIKTFEDDCVARLKQQASARTAPPRPLVRRRHWAQGHRNASPRAHVFLYSPSLSLSLLSSSPSLFPWDDGGRAA